MLKLSYLYRTGSRLLVQGFLGAALAFGGGYAQAQSVSDMTVAELSTVPLPDLAAKAWLSLDMNSGQVIGAKDIDTEVEPASLTKLMAAYVIFKAIDDGRLSMDQEVPISEKAWKTEGSRKFTTWLCWKIGRFTHVH